MFKLVGRLLAVACLLLVTTGCFEIEQLIRIDADRSGVTRITVTMDMEEALGPLFAFAGEDFDLEAQMKKVMAEQGGDMDAKFAELEANLPPGVTLGEVVQRAEGSAMVVAVDMAFADLEALSALLKGDAMNSLSGGANLPSGQVSSAGGLEIIEREGELVLQFDSFDPDDKAAADAATEEVDPQVEAMVQSMLGDMGFSLVLQTPWELVESNATEETDEGLVWRFNLMEMSDRMEQGESVPGPRVVFEVDDGQAAAAKAERMAMAPVSALSGKSTMAFAGVAGGTVRIDGTRVRVPPFDMAVTEVTQRQYKTVAKDKPSQCAAGCGKELPVQSVSWFEAVAFANALSALEGHTACYTVAGAAVSEVEGCTGFRLPTEAEFEIAMRSGGSSVFPWGDADADAGRFAWHSGNAGGRAQAVKGKQPNEAGLYDLSGNVAEWVFAPSVDGAERITRGGSFADGAGALRSDARSRAPGTIGHGHVGFRLVRSRP
ncbi:MAG: formylglycine-generating enzyme family protein [Myxococcales bacterium]|nr:formylglycine-generating enzyme family protein [Myxococcales bacterium]